MQPDRIIKVALLARSRNEKLLQCTAESLLKSVMLCAEMGLEPSGSVGGVWLVPYWNGKAACWEAQAIPDYRGLIDVARRSGVVATIEPHIVYANERFEAVFGLEPKLEHRPLMSGPRGEMLGVYAVARLKEGAVQSELMTKEEVDKIRARSKAKDSGPWVTDYEAMAKKTVIKQLCKYLPRSRELTAALQADEDDAMPIDTDLANEIVDLNPRPQLQTQAERIKDRIKKKQDVAAEVEPSESEAPEESLGGREPPPCDHEWDLKTGICGRCGAKEAGE